MNANILDSIFLYGKKISTTVGNEGKVYKQIKCSETASAFPPTNPILIIVCAVALCETVQKTAQ